MSEAVPPQTGEGRAGDAAGWGALFQQSADPIFLLNRRRRLRFVNRAWEAFTGRPSESVLGLFCLERKRKGEPQLQALARALAPPPEVLQGRAQLVRRAVPPARLGPPWWDVQFLPLLDGQGLLGVLGKITRVGEAPGPAGRGLTLSEGMMALRQQAAARYTFALCEGDAPAFTRVAAQVRAAAQTRTPVWVVGEPGTGKETTARVIHHEGLTREQTFLAIDCAGLQPFLIRNMLFGHAGLADSDRLGTVYLRDPGAMPPDVQSELLDWWAGRDRPPRVVVGTSAEPAADVQTGRVVPELLATFGVLEMRLPPLRDRLADLHRFVDALAPGGRATLTAAAREILEAYDWPGNLRELRSVLDDAVRQAAGTPVEAAHVPLYVREQVALARGAADRPGTTGRVAPALKSVLEQVERNLVTQALQKARGNKTDAAEALGLSRTELWRRIKDLGIES